MLIMDCLFSYLIWSDVMMYLVMVIRMNSIIMYMFFTGEPAKLKDDLDYVPSIFTFSTTSAKSNIEKKARYNRLIRRRKNQDNIRTKRLCNPSDNAATSE